MLAVLWIGGHQLKRHQYKSNVLFTNSFGGSSFCQYHHNSTLCVKCKTVIAYLIKVMVNYNPKWCDKVCTKWLKIIFWLFFYQFCNGNDLFLCIRIFRFTAKFSKSWWFDIYWGPCQRKMFSNIWRERKMVLQFGFGYCTINLFIATNHAALVTMANPRKKG